MSYISELKTRIEVDNIKGFSDIYADILLKISGGTLYKSNMFKSFTPYIFCRFLSMRPELRVYGEMFNGDVTWYNYLGASTFGSVFGGFLGYFSTLSFSLTIPSYGLVNVGGTLAIGITGTTTLTITGAQVLTGVAVAGLTYCYIIPKHGKPNSTINDHGNIGKYDSNGNLVLRTDNVGRPHYIKKYGDWYLPHTYRYEWKLIDGVWKIVKKWVCPF